MPFLGMDYIAYFQDEYIEVPEEVIKLYQKINTPEFQQERRKVNWMMECLTMFGFLHVVAPVKVVHEMYCQRFSASYQEFLEVFQSLPEEVNPCVVLGEKMMLSEALEKNLYRKVEKIQRQVDYYIPSEDEIDDYVKNGYFSGEPCYQKLKGFFTRELKMDLEEADNMCAIAYQGFAKGRMLSDIMEKFNRNGMEFRSQKQVEKFASLMMDANNHTRMFELRGHMPVELAGVDSLVPKHLETKIVSMRGQPSHGSVAVQEKKSQRAAIL